MLSRILKTAKFLAVAAVVHLALPSGATLVPTNEWAMIRQVAVNYGLTDEQTWLLAAIRRHENGRPGLEFGIGGPMESGHAAHRYRDGVKSFYVQAMWAAGTIRRRHRGDLTAFGYRYNPSNPSKWTASVSSIVAKLKSENANKLPGARPSVTVLKFP